MLWGEVKLIYRASHWYSCRTIKTGAFFLAEIFEKVSFDPGSLDFQPLKIFLLADKKFLGDKNMPISTV